MKNTIIPTKLYNMEITTKHNEPQENPKPSVIVSSSSNVNVEVLEINGQGVGLRVEKHPEVTLFAGYAENEKFKQLMTRSRMREKLLLAAVNNRTRERNYYLLYSRLAGGEITEEEFDSLLENNPDDYVVTADVKPTVEEFEEAYALSAKIKDADTVGDIETLFSFEEEAALSVCKIIVDGAV